jgi:hypothetical protein
MTKILYISGFGRSGSTILGNILGGIEGFFHAGELYYVWERNLVENRLCGCGAPFRECEVWAPVFERAFGGMDRLAAREVAYVQGRATRPLNAPLMLSPRGRRLLISRFSEHAARLERLYRAIGETSGSRVIVDSSKRPLYGRMLAELSGLDVYTVHLVRDPRASAYSWLRRRSQPDRGGGACMLRFNPLKSSLRWDVWNTLTEALWRGCPERRLLLRYEDFVERPRQAVGKILGMLGEEPPRLPFVEERSVELGISHTVSGNPNRFQTGVVKLRPDDEWISRMRSRDRRLVTLLTLPLLARYGYPP